MSGRGRGNNANAETLNRNFATSRGRGRGAGAAGMPPPGGPNAPARLPYQEFAEPNPQPIVEQNVQPPAPANMGLSYRGGRGRGAFEPNPPRAHARNVDPAHRATLDNRPPTDRHHGYGQDIQARRDRDHHFDASGGDHGVAAAIPAAPYMHQPAAYGQLPSQNQPMQQVSPAYGYGGGIAGQQGYQQPEPIQLHQQPGTSHQMDQQQLALSPFPAPDPANHIPFNSQRMAQMFDQISELFANMASEMEKMNQNNGSNY